MRRSAELSLVAPENLIRHELTSEVPNRVIIPPYAGDARAAAALAGVAREVAKLRISRKDAYQRRRLNELTLSQ
jgi:hypothetical protein